jgi:hypothetical protein
MPALIIHAFWSYSRNTESFGGDALHAAMQASLSEAMAPLELRVFRDSAANHGIASGADWSREIVRAIARSTLFFWIQSPRWLHRPICRFELEAFHSRVQRAANLLAPGDTSTFEKLWTAMTIPIRWLDAAAAQWQAVPEPPRSFIAHAWRHMNVRPSLMLPESRRQHRHDVYALACVDAAAAIHAHLAAALRQCGSDWQQWLELLDRDAVAFERLWLAEFAARRLTGGADDALAPTPGLDLVGSQLELAQRLNSGRTRIAREELGLTMILVPHADSASGAFWVTSAPVTNRLATTWADYFGENFRASPGSGGVLRWSAEAVQKLRPSLQDIGLDLPNAAQAAWLMRLSEQERAVVHRLGLQSAPRNFWFAASDGHLHTQDGNSGPGALILALQ